MTRLYEVVLLPLLRVLYVPLDLVLGWTSFLPSVAGVTAVGVISGLGVMLLQKYCSNQDLLRRCKADLALIKSRMKGADPASAARLAGLRGRVVGKYAGAAMRPSLWSIPIITVVALWAGARMANQPVRPGEDLEVEAYFEDGAEGYAHIVPSPAISVVGPPVAVIGAVGSGRQARWKVRALQAGDWELEVRYADRSHVVELPVSASGGRPPEEVVVFQRESAGQDQLQAVRLALVPGMKDAWWNLMMGWAGLYLGVAMIFAFFFKWLLRIS